MAKVINCGIFVLMARLSFDPAAAMLFGTLATLAASWLVWTFVEKPCRAMVKRGAWGFAAPRSGTGADPAYAPRTLG